MSSASEFGQQIVCLEKLAMILQECLIFYALIIKVSKIKFHRRMKGVHVVCLITQAPIPGTDSLYSQMMVAYQQMVSDCSALSGDSTQIFY